MIHTHVSEDTCYGNRVKDIGLAGFSSLTLVGFGAEEVGAVDFANLRRFQVTLQVNAQITYQKPGLIRLLIKRRTVEDGERVRHVRFWKCKRLT